MRTKGSARTVRGAVSRALADGVLAPADHCEACGATDLRSHYVLHHWSYAREHWLDVIPLCRPCHRRVHFGLLAEPRTGRLYPRWSRRPAPPPTAEALSARRATRRRLRTMLARGEAFQLLARVTFRRRTAWPVIEAAARELLALGARDLIDSLGAIEASRRLGFHWLPGLDYAEAA